MSKIAVVTDSNSGITQAQALELGISVIPMPFMIDGETYFEEITLSRRECVKRRYFNFTTFTGSHFGVVGHAFKGE